MVNGMLEMYVRRFLSGMSPDVPAKSAFLPKTTNLG